MSFEISQIALFVAVISDGRPVATSRPAAKFVSIISASAKRVPPGNFCFGSASTSLSRMGNTSGTVTDLSKEFDTAPYLTPHSDAVALLVLAHQTYVHNLITAVGYQARTAPDDTMRIEGAAERLIQGMLFSREAAIPDGIVGTSSYTSDFMKAGPRDRKGRSLRVFELDHRLFRYPLSYLIYSDSFDALPLVAKQYVYHRLHEVLNGRDQRPQFEHLSIADRLAIREILVDTKSDFARIS